MTAPKHRILCFDPGTNNFTFSLIAGKPDVEIFGVLKDPIYSLTTKNFNSYVSDLKKELKRIVNSSNANRVVIERYQTRFGGLNNEIINIMIGILVATSTVPVHLITASTWKNYIKAKYNIEDLYKNFEKLELSDHVIDSIYMGVYSLEKNFGKHNILKQLMKKKRKWSCFRKGKVRGV